MRLFILATVIGCSLAVQWKIPAAMDKQNTAARNQISNDQGLSDEQKATVLAAFDALRSGRSLTDVYDNIIATSGLTADQFNEATLHVEQAVADVGGFAPPVHHYLSNQELAAATGISEEQIEAYSANNATSSPPETPVDPAQQQPAGGMIDLPPVSQAPPKIDLFSVSGMPNSNSQ